MRDVAWHHEVNCVRSKDAQKQLARTSLNKDPDYKRDSSSPSLSHNRLSNVFIKDGGLCE